MNTLINSNRIKSSYFNFIKSGSIEIFCPFITYDVLDQVIKTSQNIDRIITRWRLCDFQEGFADLGIFDLCQENQIHLYINPRIHLKTTIRDSKDVYLSTANLTGKGLNLNLEDSSYNYELSNIVKLSGIKDLIYFEAIVQDSIFVNEEVFEEIKDRIKELERDSFSKQDEFSFMKDKAYYISQLPQTTSPELLFEFYSESIDEYSEEDYNCAIHDLSIYDIPEGLEYEEFQDELGKAFFEHPFISGLIDEVKKDGYIYFGRVKEWIQNNCLDVPVPKRRELTGKTQVLYKWIEELGEGKFEIDRPNHSQRIICIED